MAGARAPRWVATIVAVGIGLVALFGLTASEVVVSSAQHCTSESRVVCEPSVGAGQPAPQASAVPGTRASVPCLQSAGCGGGGVLTLIGAGLALLLVAAPLVLLPWSLSWPVRPPKTVRVPQLLVVHDDEQPPRLATVI